MRTTELRRLCFKSLPTYNFRWKTAYLLFSTAVVMSWLSDRLIWQTLLEILQPFDSTWRLWSSIILQTRYASRGCLRNSESSCTLETQRICVRKNSGRDSAQIICETWNFQGLLQRLCDSKSSHEWEAQGWQKNNASTSSLEPFTAGTINFSNFFTIAISLKTFVYQTCAELAYKI